MTQSKNKKLIATTYSKMNQTTFGKKGINLYKIFKKSDRKYKNNKKAIEFTIKNINKIYSPDSNLNLGQQISDLFRNVEIHIPPKGFIYSLDELKNIIHKNNIIDNISVDYSKILNNSLNDLRLKYQSEEIENLEYNINQNALIDGIELLIDREINALEKSSRKDKEKFIGYLNNIKYNKVTDNFEEALQRILFFNQILWQTGHGLNGLGRLDKILNNIYKNDENLTEDYAFYLIKEFLKSLHEYYWFKSNELMGDTGQVIILGGKEEDNSYFYNELTNFFIDANKELQLPDPKILLRVSQQTPRFLMEKSLESMNTGIGSPLISNDDIVISKLIKFGYDSKDAYNYVVSACWEPAPIGTGMEVNNVNTIVFIKPLNDLLDKEDLNSIQSFDILINKYKSYLKIYIEDLIQNLNEIIWEEDPILSLFIEECDKNQIDISNGGAKYNNIGVTSVSLGNTVNSLINIKNMVFTNKEFDLNYLNQERINNFKDENLLRKLKDENKKFGTDDDEIIQLTNEITQFVSDIFNKQSTPFGGKFKFGLSAPTYINGASEIKASLDGRKDFEPFSVHISKDNNQQDYTELMRFASKLNYSENRFNGNVTDFIVNPNFIEENFEKFLDFLILSIKLGFFQMQMNVVSSDTLIKAKNEPNKFPNLIVRVWGFSAYFNDLPLSYKNVLIERALKNEGKI